MKSAEEMALYTNSCQYMGYECEIEYIEHKIIMAAKEGNYEVKFCFRLLEETISKLENLHYVVYTFKEGSKYFSVIKW